MKNLELDTEEDPDNKANASPILDQPSTKSMKPSFKLDMGKVTGLTMNNIPAPEDEISQQPGITPSKNLLGKANYRNIA